MSIADQIIAEAQAQGLDPRIALEVAMAESGLKQNAVSAKGAIGVFQLEPATAAQLGVDATVLEQNIRGGVAYLLQMLARFGGNVQAALAAYNAGPERVTAAIQAGGNWLSRLPSETRAYVAKISAQLAAYTARVSPTGVVQTVVQSLPQRQQQALRGAVWVLAGALALWLAVDAIQP
jgi:soluble lytic murein transglycosylase-like protein